MIIFFVLKLQLEVHFCSKEHKKMVRTTDLQATGLIASLSNKLEASSLCLQIATELPVRIFIVHPTSIGRNRRHGGGTEAKLFQHGYQNCRTQFAVTFFWTILFLRGFEEASSGAPCLMPRSPRPDTITFLDRNHLDCC